MIEILFPYLIGSVAFNIVLFLIAYKLQSDKLTDISYALTFLFIAITAFVVNNTTIYTVIVLTMVALWAIRIGGFLLYRVIKSGKDSRFDSMRSHFFKFGQFWLLQGMSVWILMIPVTLALYSKSSQIGLVSYVGLLIFLFGLSVETIADLQKSKFKDNIANHNKWIDSGLWRYSRHPNYFGEILIWIGFYIYAIQSLGLFSALVALISPVFISLLLIFVSGIPLLEKSANSRWGKDEKYIDYKRKTSVLILMPNRKIQSKQVK